LAALSRGESREIVEVLRGPERVYAVIRGGARRLRQSEQVVFQVCSVENSCQGWSARVLVDAYNSIRSGAVNG